MSDVDDNLTGFWVFRASKVAHLLVGQPGYQKGELILKFSIIRHKSIQPANPEGDRHAKAHKF